MLTKKDFLEQFNQKLKDGLSMPLSFGEFKKKFLESKEELYTHYEYLEKQDFLLKANEILQKIASICQKPQIKTDVEEVIKRSELADKLDPASFKETIKDTKNWKNKGSHMEPENVHTIEYIDSIKTYENTFIANLVDEIASGIENITTTIGPLVKAIEQEYETKGITYGKNSMIKDLSFNGYPVKKDFIIDKGNSEYILSLAKETLKRIKQIQSSSLYKVNHSTKIQSVHQTNILLHDHLYSACYRFYLNYFFMKKVNYISNKNTEYYNFFVVNLLYYLKENIKNETKIFLENDKLRFNSISYREGLFEIIINDNAKKPSLEIITQLKNGESTLTSRNYVYVTWSYNSDNKNEINSIMQEHMKEDSNAILVCQNNIIERYKDLLNISIYQKNNDEYIKNLFSSLVVLLEVQKGLFEKLCPVCGSPFVTVKNNNRVCSHCKSIYELMEYENKTYVWIKSLRRDNL